jgi:hypothetical protein
MLDRKRYKIRGNHMEKLKLILTTLAFLVGSTVMAFFLTVNGIYFGLFF